MENLFIFRSFHIRAIEISKFSYIYFLRMEQNRKKLFLELSAFSLFLKEKNGLYISVLFQKMLSNIFFFREMLHLYVDTFLEGMTLQTIAMGVHKSCHTLIFLYFLRENKTKARGWCLEIKLI